MIPDDIKHNLTRMAHRATVRRYDASGPIDDNVLDAVLRAASHAPSTGNMQLYTVIVSRDPEALKRLQALHLGQPMAGSCSALLTFCADTRRFARWCEARKTSSGLDNLSGLLLAVADATIFAQQAVAAAEAAGIGTCYLGTVTYDLDGFARELELPDGVLPLFAVAMGYPDGELPQPSDRLPLEAVVHREKYHDPSDADIDRYYADKEELEESARFIAENGRETLAQVYAEVRYPRAMNEKISDDLRAFVGKWK